MFLPRYTPTPSPITVIKRLITGYYMFKRAFTTFDNYKQLGLKNPQGDIAKTKQNSTTTKKGDSNYQNYLAPKCSRLNDVKFKSNYD